MDYRDLNSEKAAALLACLSRSTLALSDAVREAQEGLSDDEIRAFRNEVYWVIVAINEKLVEPLQRRYPELVPKDD